MSYIYDILTGGENDNDNDNTLLYNNDLKKRTNEEWSELARYYAKTNAILIPRALYRGIKNDKEITIADDWMLDENTLLLFHVMGVKSTDTVDALLGTWIAHTDPEGNISHFPQYNILHWDPITFSWNCKAEKLSEINLAFTDRGFDLTQDHTAFLDVPFGHVVSQIHADAIDTLSGPILRYYAVPACTLGKIGRDFCNKYGPPYERMLIL